VPSLPATLGADVIALPAQAQFEAFLDEHRGQLSRSLDGLTQEQARRSLVPSATTLLGLVKHATFLEKVWFDQVITGRSRAELGLPENSGDSFLLDAGDTIAGVQQAHREACASSRRATATLGRTTSSTATGVAPSPCAGCTCTSCANWPSTTATPTSCANSSWTARPAEPVQARKWGSCPMPRVPTGLHTRQQAAGSRGGVRGTMATTLGERFARDLAGHDEAALRALLASPVDFQALTPGRHWQADTGQQVVGEIMFGHWFDGAKIRELCSVSTGHVAGREHVAYRLRVERAGREYLLEQQAYYDTDGGQITWMRLLCSGYQAVRPGR
jgi:hypothetical protein